MTDRWTLRTASTEYVVRLGLDGTALLLDGWVPAGSLPPTTWQAPEDRNTSWELDADLAPVEHATAGTRQHSHPDLLVDLGEGLLGARWQHVGSDLTDDGPRTRLVVRFADTTDRLLLALHTVTSRAHDVVRRWADVTNAGREPAVLRRALSGGWAVPAPHGARVHYLSGRWGDEYVPQQVDLRAGELTFGSRQGVTSHQFAPYVAVEPLAADGAVAPDAGVVSTQLAWSGSWRTVVEASPAARTVRVAMGLHDDQLAISLGEGETFRTPDTVGVRAATVDDIARAWHHYERVELTRDTGPEHRPVVYNSWYATTFDVQVGHQLRLAEVAAAAGVEAFVVDDGWFRGRDDDRHGLGDWTPDERKFPAGLGPLVDGVLERGLRFGLWIEPECVNPGSALHRAHPDWVYRAGDRPITTMRHQLVLDLGRREVEAWATGMLRDLLSSYPITFLKWDMNRPVTDGGRPGSSASARWSVDHTLAYYRVLDVVRAEFPHVTLEACAGGGGRVDLAVLGRSDVVWASDETGPRDRLLVQDGWLRCYPAWAMSSWVSDLPGTRDTRPVSRGFRYVVAMAGALGIGSDLLAWSTDAAKTAATYVDLYKQLRPVLHGGQVRRVGDPRHGVYSVQYTTPERIVVLVWDQRQGEADAGGPVTVPVPDTAPGAAYRQPDGATVSGRALAQHGVPVTWALADDADVIVLDRVR